METSLIKQSISHEEDLSTLSDSDLYHRVQEYGLNARIWKRKFAGLLPEVFRRGLYKKRGFASIYEFAFKLAGMSERSVDKILNLAKHIESMSTLKRQLETGIQGWSKLEVVAHVATPSTEKFWVDKLNKLSFHSLKAYVSEVKKLENVRRDGSMDFTNVENESYVTGAGHVENKMDFLQDVEQASHEPCLQESWSNDNPYNSEKNWHKMSFPISPDVEQSLRVFKEKNKCMTFNEALKLLLEQKQKNVAKKEVKIEVCPDCATKEGKSSSGRYIPAKVRHIVESKYKGICGFRGCKSPATNLHHTKRYSLQSNHDPDFIVPLCTAHERLVHAGLIEDEEKPPEQWQIRRQPEINSPKFQIDQAVQKYRREKSHLTAMMSTP